MIHQRNLLKWHPRSWRNLPARQQPIYPSMRELECIVEELTALPPLVSCAEIEQLKHKIAAAQKGKSFVLQAGDCAERFEDCRSSIISQKLVMMQQLSQLLSHAAQVPIISIGRIAGQYAKPRSRDYEITAAGPLPIYRGDIVNSFAADAFGRLADPQRMLQSYHHAATTLNYLRSIAPSGATETPLYSSHEGLLLPYEEALCRRSGCGTYYNLGAHMLWIGERTRALSEAHVEMFRGIQNPIGIKIGTSIVAQDLCALISRLNPEQQPGKIMLITRLGATCVRETLPPLIDAVGQAGLNVLWSCDPMHGNTRMDSHGNKSRHLDDIIAEITQTYACHKEAGTYLGGIHLETSVDLVKECIGGRYHEEHAEEMRGYQSYCDPRLNPQQSIEVVSQLAALMSSGTSARS